MTTESQPILTPLTAAQEALLVHPRDISLPMGQVQNELNSRMETLKDLLPTPKMLGLSVVIPSYNDLPSLLKCVKSLMLTGRKWGEAGRLQILVQDDHSPDFDVNEILNPPILPERNEINLGFGGNCNAGAARSQGDILLFLNQDTLAHEGWFEPLMAMFDDPKVGIVGPKLVFPAGEDGVENIQSCGGLYDAGKGPYHRYLGYASDDWRVNVKQKVSWTTGAAVAIRRSAFVMAGGFDMGYGRGYFEDTELCMRVAQQGLECWYTPEAVFTHKVGTSGAATAQSFRDNSIRFHVRWNHLIIPDTQAIYVNY